MAKVEKLPKAVVDEALSGLEGWAREDEQWLCCTYKLASFKDAIAFVQRVAVIAEEMDHHPSISIDYKKVILRLSTHDAGGLTELDLHAARRYNESAAYFLTG
ncbi:4a-hydroxytetrahydrobiopterin dehydratase [Paenibacillus nasutitermitis]|uniref:Putative pterin-4-alpha-carbinolamine dehydratase n=1 Tax=Paenibacillus nasutitermitis TaxID=1652958 RepID=A0A916ZGL0_9BACL|nr:4a-hydroxytetrahydrobiopterin dehydratase [Paenibacillus nasutitermitis]GGD96632.1 putative pterin-4-alpha-carbinolamine dehydratase [Paenibacillus nasutitermitis]